MASKLASIVAVGAIMALTGCSERDSQSDYIERITPQWTTLADGSKFAIVDPYERDETDAAASHTTIGVRCWPTDGAPVRCIRVTNTSGLTHFLSVKFTRDTELPTAIIWDGPENGYSCSTVLGYLVEEIHRQGAVLTSNRIDYGTPPWSRSYVTRYMRDNNVEGDWFDCGQIIRAVHRGSLQTLSTSSVTEAMIPR